MHAFDAMTVREKMDSTQKVTEEGGRRIPATLPLAPSPDAG